VDESGRPLVHAADVAVSADGQLVYVSDFAQGVIHVYDLAAPEARYFGLQSPMLNPFGLDLDSAGNLYVVEQGAQQIRVMNPSGQTTRLIRDERLIRPTDVAVDEDRGRIYVADPSRQASQEHFVRIFDLEGNYIGEVGKGRGTGGGYLHFPTYLVLDGEGNLYVTDTMNSRVSVFSPEGEFLRTVGERGDGFGQFDKPKGVALDSLGNLYVADSSWSNVQIFNPEGDVLLYFGGRGVYPGLLSNPTGVAIASGTNTIFVGDYLNRRLCIYQLVNTDSAADVPRASDQDPAAATD
jgi:DNA-binding beta-propeller fold protein YncE